MPFIRYNDGTIQYADPPTYRAMLLPVTGRGDVRFLPPTTFMGQPLEDNGPLTVGQLAIDYLSALVEEARGRS
jgi:hypothetical protein